MTITLKRISWVVFLALLLLVIPRLSGIVASLFNYSAVDPDGSYAWISVHHIVQALIFSAVMAILSKYKNLEYGLKWGDRAAGKQYVLTFSFYFGIYTAGAFLTIFLTNSFQPFEYPLTAVNIIGQIGFQLLLSGPSEELIFRAFAITMLALMIKGKILNGRLSYANIIAAVVFGLAHVGFSFAPFELRYSAFQVIYSIVLGLFYGDCFEKTGSVYYPMMMHSITNVVMVGIIIIASLLIA
ncbi:MAG: CPBP family intramembrane glutamic endopeptidase [Bacillota bacterium]|nr:CPBP family intramembrane glutamic endopeptidase [Bacillota bacterium]